MLEESLTLMEGSSLLGFAALPDDEENVWKGNHESQYSISLSRIVIKKKVFSDVQEDLDNTATVIRRDRSFDDVVIHNMYSELAHLLDRFASSALGAFE